MNGAIGIPLLILAAATNAAAQTLPTRPPTSRPTPLTIQQAEHRDLAQLLTTLNDPQVHQDKRDEAAQRLAERPDPGVRQMLLSVLMNESNPRGQLAVAGALALRPNNDVAFINPLFSLIGTDRGLSEAAADALAGYGSSIEVLNRLISRASSPDDSLVARSAAIGAIGQFPRKRAAEALVSLLDDKQPQPVQAAAADALAQLTGLDEAEPDGWRQWWKGASTLSEEQFMVQLLADRSPRYNQSRLKQLQLDQNLQVLLREQYRLATDKPDMLLRYLRSGAPLVRQIGAQQVLDDLKNAIPPADAVKQQLRTMIADSSAQVRLQVAMTLAAINDRDSVEALLVQLSREPDPRVRAALAGALAPIRDVDAAPELLNLLNDPSSRVVQAACRALTEVAPMLRGQRPAMADQAAEDLIQLIHARTVPGGGEIREAAVEALGSLKYPPALKVLALMLRDVETVAVRRAALRALGELGDSRAQDLIIQNALDDPNKDIRLAAVNALSDTATFAAAEALYRHIQPENEPDERVRDAAWRVLEKLFPTAPAGQLALWPDRFANQPQRQVVVLKALVGTYEKEGDSDRLAFARQNLGAVLMKLNNPGEASGYFNQALQHWIDAGNNMLTQGLIRQNIEALLRAGEFEKAAAFASDMIRRNLSDQQTMGIAIRDEAQRLADGGGKASLPKLLAAVGKMNPPLDSNYTSQLQDIIKSAGK